MCDFNKIRSQDTVTKHLGMALSNYDTRKANLACVGLSGDELGRMR